MNSRKEIILKNAFSILTSSLHSFWFSKTKVEEGNEIWFPLKQKDSNFLCEEIWTDLNFAILRIPWDFEWRLILSELLQSIFLYFAIDGYRVQGVEALQWKQINRFNLAFLNLVLVTASWKTGLGKLLFEEVSQF